MTGPAPALLRPADYLDPAVLAEERERLFARCWHLAGLVRDLPAADDWRLVTVAGAEVILQNVGDEIRGFSNVCPHRFAALRRGPSGNGPLRCPYHLWSFDRDGVPEAVPFRADLTLEACRQHRLDRWSVERCGALVFVARRPDRPLADWLGAAFAPLAALSCGIGREVEQVEQDIAANWKVILQNTVEFDHAFGVHPATFAPMVARPLTLEERPAPPPHLAYRTIMRTPEPRHRGERLVAALFARAALPPLEGYLHYTLFPSATIGTTGNRQIALVRYQPVAPGVTSAEARLFLAEIPGLTAAEQAILDRVVPVDVAFTRQLLAEDRQICETVQRGLANAPAGMPGCLMPGERLVERFQRSWRAEMGRDRDCCPPPS